MARNMGTNGTFARISGYSNEDGVLVASGVRRGEPTVNILNYQEYTRAFANYQDPEQAFCISRKC